MVRSSTCSSRPVGTPQRPGGFHRAPTTLKVTPGEVVTDANPVYPRVRDDLVPSAWHHIERHANNPIEADHSQLKHRLRPIRGLRTDRTAQTSSPAMPSFRTSDEDTTNSPLTSRPVCGWPPRLRNWPEPSDSAR
ncbi:DDE superfamily endonuclease [Micromonospora olivasterospora]|uniref:DDE superfamily endonuclease n=1 Tax=Micromonospora olivasterospora TaxID=1880 RepID=A0A562I975_MICOL|nr:DDE superfamily endonuclease [Micromonospora olivasterospora]